MDNKDTPLVSVLMTAYNRELFITEAIESVLASSYTNFELIVVDDCSTDRTASMARRQVDFDKRVTLYINEQNLGDYHNRNKAASYAKGKYLKYLDSDDVMYPWCLEAMVQCMEKFPAAGFGVCAYHHGSPDPYPYMLDPFRSYKGFFYENKYFLMGPSGAIIRRKTFEQFGGFTGEKYIGDTDLWLRIGARFGVVILPMDLIWWRQHPGQQMLEEMKDRSVRNLRYVRSRDLVKHEDCPLGPVERKAVLKNLANVRMRDILLRFFKTLNIVELYRSMRQCKFSVLDFYKALRTNNYP